MTFSVVTLKSLSLLNKFSLHCRLDMSCEYAYVSGKEHFSLKVHLSNYYFSMSSTLSTYVL